MPSSSEASPAFAGFLGCVEDFYRHAGRELPFFDADAQSPVTFEASVDDVTFYVGYDPTAGEASLFVYCPFGPVPADDEALVLRRLLGLNVDAARDHNATYCVDTSTDEVAYYVRRDPLQVDAAWLREELVRVAKQAEQWRDEPLRSGSVDGPAANGSDGAFAPWLAFA